MSADFILTIGFLVSVYAVIGNDVIQTLGTFIASNKQTHWLFLWAFIGAILACTIFYGWYTRGGEVSYGRLDHIPFPENSHWIILAAPVSLLILTKLSIPVSTTFLILSIFSSQQLVEKMILKSIYGYAISFVSAFLIYLLVAKWIESKKSIRKLKKSKQKIWWKYAQWLSTGFLWSQWLIQDFANIYVFMPRQLSLSDLLTSLGIILAVLAFIFYRKGGSIQNLVNQKTNTENIRSATIIDLCFGLVLFLYGHLSSVPMSTTWTFIGILGGRELAIRYLLNKGGMKLAYRAIFTDLAKVNIGLAISVFVVWLIQLLR